MIEIVSVSFFLIASFLAISLKKNIELMEKIDEIQEALENSLEILEIQSKKIEQKAKLEVFSDEPVVRNLIKDIIESKNAVVRVAKLLDDSMIEDSIEGKEEE
jgi:PIN domain nuclease of toxin-antitoxin system